MSNQTLERNGFISRLSKFFSPKLEETDARLSEYIQGIDEFNSAQPNCEMLNAIRAYNHSIINSLNTIRPLAGSRILDIGASPHGYALERCLKLNAAEYVGIGLDISETSVLVTDKGKAELMYMNAEALSFKDSEFDAIVTMSTFEHIGDLRKTLLEFQRVLKPEGLILISFEPIWTCSYGHHLHHLGEISQLVPDWAHLLWNRQEMGDYLRPRWPANAPLTVEEACHWIYEGDALNRKGIVEMRQILDDCPMRVEWIMPMPDQDRDLTQLQIAQEKTGLSKEDLMTKGLSVLIYKQ
jgi:ubiquinone/menaquinone biosynthesis C-methylase UbiE